MEDSYVAQSLNYFFSSIVTNLKTTEYTDNNSNSKNISNPLVKIILKYRNHPSILTIEEVFKEIFASLFSFSEGCKEEVLRETLNLDASKTYQGTDVLMQIYLQNFCTQTLNNLSKIPNLYLL